MLLVLVAGVEWRDIETDIANRANTRLASEGLNWAHVETYSRGRNVLLTGEPNNQTEVDRATQIIKSVRGVESLTLSAEVSVAKAAPDLRLTFSDQGVELRGTLASQTEIKHAIATAKELFPSRKISSELLSSEHVGQLVKLKDLLAALADYSNKLDHVTIELADSKLLMRGHVDDQPSKNTLFATLKTAFNGPVANQLTVVTPRDFCQELINTLSEEQNIGFNSGSTVIEESSFELLKTLSRKVERCQNAKLQVVGHTDSKGNLETNMLLSKDRAQAVIDFLVEQGLDVARFSAVGAGPNEPISDNTSEAGRAKNRRIELRLVN
ncbi:OmpA family protein [Arenicella xantha]|uniref:BON domain-containing protein n=1 Tax=Arenicella xantha TaxID=644221 RepID=A0A395JGF3_9GAMM|nr:OmpA family protein [Arenicella xantha]RBP48893.1 BON domain-containing protein [Arenicella xantha]